MLTEVMFLHWCGVCGEGGGGGRGGRQRGGERERESDVYPSVIRIILKDIFS